MKKLFTIILFFFIGLGWLSAQTGFTLRGESKKVRIPFRIHSNLIVIPLILNNRIPLKFIVDTGVRNAILTEKIYTDMLNVGYSRKYTIRGAGGAFLIDAYLSKGVTLTLPGLEGSGNILFVLENDYIELRNFLGTEVHGMIGYELFSRFIVEINYAKKIITLHDPASFKPKRLYREMPMAVEDTKPFIYTKVTMDNGSTINARMLVDTGASHGIMLEPQSGDSIIISEKTIDAIIGRGLGGAIEGQIGRLESISIGDYEINSPIVTFPYPNSYMDSLFVNATFRNGSLGGELLSRFNIVFDYGNEKMYFKKNSKFKRQFYYNLSGITIKAVGANLEDFEIDEVREHSNAYQVGLRKGDRINAINGLSTENLDLGIVNSILNSKPNKKIRIAILRNGEVQKFSFRLQSPI
ncbi:MAG: aspartyl protease family protein [Cyclobacteriaceae bacterium]|nr:aspartyl protease family protein [Cyclobacteriaceae bacterium]